MEMVATVGELQERLAKVEKLLKTSLEFRAACAPECERCAMNEKRTISALQLEVKEWADSVFPGRTAHHALCKLMLEEIPEFALNTRGEDEYADLVILVLDIATLNGIDIAGAVTRKMEINRQRNWRIDLQTGMMKHWESARHER